MSFLAIQETDLSSGDAAKGYKIYFSPLPSAAIYPTVWLDLHIGGDYYQDCEDDRTRREYQPPDKTGKPWVRIGPRRGVRLYTEERIGIDCNHTAVVTNVAGRAKHGLIVAPGKIDPGFDPNRLVLVVFNQSNRHCTLHVRDKIASIAFAQTTTPCSPTVSRGHANGLLPDFDVRMLQKIWNWIASRDYQHFCFEILKLMIAAGLALLVAWLGGYLGISKP